MADRRPGTKGASQLLKAPQVDVWQCMLLNYDDAVARVAKSKKKPELISLDKWIWKEFPDMVKERSPPSCTKDELSRIMQWKLLRGKNRPALMNLIRQNAESVVQAVSQEAFHLLFSSKGAFWKEALAKLAELRGVGPATASALLAPLCSSIPFMADETLEAVTHRKRDYTLSVYVDMHAALQEVSRDKLGGQLSPEEAGKALWTAAMLSIHPPATPTAASTAATTAIDTAAATSSNTKSISKSKTSVNDVSDVFHVQTGDGAVQTTKRSSKRGRPSTETETGGASSSSLNEEHGEDPSMQPPPTDDRAERRSKRTKGLQNQK